MLIYRIITAALLVLALGVLLVGLPKPLFVSSLLSIILVATWEWVNLSGYKATSSKIAFMGVFLIMAFCIFIWLDFSESFNYGRALVSLYWTVPILGVFVFVTFRNSEFRNTIFRSDTSLTIFGMLLFCVLWISILLISSHESGRSLLLFGISIVVLSDVGGYIFGKLFGRNKLAPEISPGKTWEGFLGSVILPLAALFFVNNTLPILDPLNYAGAGIVTFIFTLLPVILISITGDLFISLFKRASGTKDSGDILPGHGGMLDRIDGLLLAFPVYAAIISSLVMS